MATSAIDLARTFAASIKPSASALPPLFAVTEGGPTSSGLPVPVSLLGPLARHGRESRATETAAQTACAQVTQDFRSRGMANSTAHFAALRAVYLKRESDLSALRLRWRAERSEEDKESLDALAHGLTNGVARAHLSEHVPTSLIAPFDRLALEIGELARRTEADRQRLNQSLSDSLLNTAVKASLERRSEKDIQDAELALIDAWFEGLTAKQLTTFERFQRGQSSVELKEPPLDAELSRVLLVKEWATIFGCSRNPAGIRLRQLEKEGKATNQLGRGWRVSLTALTARQRLMANELRTSRPNSRAGKK